MSSTDGLEQLVGLEDRILARAPVLYKAEDAMTMMKEHFIGIDVSMDQCDIAVLGEKLLPNSQTRKEALQSSLSKCVRSNQI